jgi:hypothetical protein
MVSSLYTNSYTLFIPDLGDYTLDPIGAFYDSQSTVYDNALSIADKTGVLVDSQGRKVSVTQLQSLDTNHDGVLSIAESSSLRLLADLNENGRLDAGELNAVTSEIWSVDWGKMTPGNAAMAGYEVSAPTVMSTAQLTVVNLTQPDQIDLTQTLPNSNYRTLRDTDNRYWINTYSRIDWSSTQVKINNGTRNTLVGTDGKLQKLCVVVPDGADELHGWWWR